MELCVEKDRVVTLEYHVTDVSGNLIDEGRTPLIYLHGAGNLFSAVEKELEQKEVGESVKVYLTPEQAFGIYDVDCLRIEARDHFPADLEVGIMVESIQSEPNDRVKDYGVWKIGSDFVVLDGNHILAGTFLIFNATVAHIRVASSLELQKGSVARRFAE